MNEFGKRLKGLLTRRRGYSKKTVYNALGLLKASFKAFNPSMHINVSIGQRNRPEILIPTAEEVSEMINLANDDLNSTNSSVIFCTKKTPQSNT